MVDLGAQSAHSWHQRELRINSDLGLDPISAELRRATQRPVYALHRGFNCVVGTSDEDLEQQLGADQRQRDVTQFVDDYEHVAGCVTSKAKETLLVPGLK